MPDSSFFFDLGYAGLFLASFLAATVVPFSSEVLLGIFIYSGYDIYISVMLATFGNFAGGMSGYYLGRLGKWEFIEKYMRIKHEKMCLYRDRIVPYSGLAAFMTWLPFVGDFICVALGFFKCSVRRIVIYMFAGKFFRYVVFSYFTFQIVL